MNKAISLAMIIALSISAYFIPLNITPEAKLVISILTFGILMWVTEIIPLFITSLIVTVLLVILKIFSMNEAVIRFFDPVLVLIFGGFLIAEAMKEHNLDKKLANIIISKIKNDKHALLALMFISAFLSLWISNTVTTLLMIPIGLGIIIKMHKKMENFAKAIVLGVAFSSNVGGAGTIIGTPPNALAVSKLSELSNISITFLEWALKAIPLIIILIPIIWIVLLKVFPFAKRNIPQIQKTAKFTKSQDLFTIIFILTVIFWFTESIHKISATIISISSATLLFLFNLLRKESLKRIDWSILILLGGGLVLGSAVFHTGLANYIAEKLSLLLINLNPILIISILILFSIGLSTFASNTATAAITIPIMVSLANIFDMETKLLVFVTTVAVSFAFLLPISTPPNAIAYSTDLIKIKDMLKAGVLISIISIIVLVIFSYILL